jgi:uncharacterized protein
VLCRKEERVFPPPGQERLSHAMPMIIDAHVHAGVYRLHYPDQFAQQMMASVNQPPEAITTNIDALIAEMDSVGIDKVFLLAFDVQRTLGARVPNEYVAELCQLHPDRLIGFCSVDGASADAADTVARWGRHKAIKGIKIAPAYLKLSPTDRCWYPVYETAQSLGLPILIHTGFTPNKAADQRFFPPMLVREVARQFPALRLIMAHLGSPWVQQCLDLLGQCSNLYADISIFGSYQPIERVAQTLATARARGILDRLLWGTDHPWGSLTEFRARMDRLAQDATLFPDRQALMPQEWAHVMGATALSLLPTT